MVMNAIQQHIEQSRRQCLDFVNATFDVLLEKVKANADFLEEMNDTNGGYKAALIADAAEDTPQLPNIAGILPLPTKEKPIVKEAVEKLELEHEYTSNLMPQDRYEKLCCYVISGHANGMEVSAQWVSETLIKQGLAIVQKQEEHLEQLRGIRSAMIRKEMDLQTAKSQHGVEPFEFAALEELAKKHGLK